MLMAPIFTVLFGPIESVTIVVLLEILISAQLMPQILNDTQWRFVIPLCLSATFLMPLGTHLLASTDPKLLARAMAIVVLLFVMMLMTGWRYRGKRGLIPTLGVGYLGHIDGGDRYGESACTHLYAIRPGRRCDRPSQHDRLPIGNSRCSAGCICVNGDALLASDREGAAVDAKLRHRCVGRRPSVSPFD
jgi:hypothetical protein